MGGAASQWHHRRGNKAMESPMAKQNDLSRCLVTLEQDATVIAVIEMGQSSWLLAGIVPGLERNPLKKLSPDPDALLQLLHRWQKEAVQAGRAIKRIVVAYEAGRDGFWLARWLRARGIEAHVIHPSSVPVSREHRRAKTDRLDTELLKRAFLGWLRGEPKHCSMAAIPTVADEDTKRPGRERQSLVGERTRIINRVKANLARLGIRGFRPNLAQASSRLEALRTPEGTAVPVNTLAELRRDMDRLRFVKQRSRKSRQPAPRAWREPPTSKAMRWYGCLRGSSVLALRPQTCSRRRCSRAISGIVRPSRAMRASPAHPTRVVKNDASEGLPKRAMPACAAG
jgi:transposase